MIEKLSSTGVVLLALLYFFLAGQVAVCSHEGSIQQESERDSGESDRSELFCGGDCQNISSVAIVSSPPARSFFPLIGWEVIVVGLSFRSTQLPLASSRAPPLAVLS